MWDANCSLQAKIVQPGEHCVYERISLVYNHFPVVMKQALMALQMTNMRQDGLSGAPQDAPNLKLHLSTR